MMLFNFIILALLILSYFSEYDVLAGVFNFFRGIHRGIKDWFIYDKKRDGKAQYSQRKLMEAYNLGDRDTIIRWLEYFTNPFVLDCYIESGKKVNSYLAKVIFSCWGNPNEGKTKGKSTFVSKFLKGNEKENNDPYKDVEHIILYKFPNMKDFYSKIDYFPPAVAKEILQVI